MKYWPCQRHVSKVAYSPPGHIPASRVLGPFLRRLAPAPVRPVERPLDPDLVDRDLLELVVWNAGQLGQALASWIELRGHGVHPDRLSAYRLTRRGKCARSGNSLSSSENLCLPLAAPSEQTHQAEAGGEERESGGEGDHTPKLICPSSCRREESVRRCGGTIGNYERIGRNTPR